MLPTLQLLERLMACKPVTADVAAVNEAVEILRQYLEEHQVYTEVETLDGRKLLFAATRAGKTQDVVLNAHLDVVPAPAEMFDIRAAEKGWVAGRGAGDCLGNAAVLAQVLVRLNGKVGVGGAFSTDEETGGKTTRCFVDRGYRARRLYCVMDGDGYALIVGQKGVISLTLTAVGTSCHAAKPWEGENALDRLVTSYCRVRELFPPVSADDSWHPTMAPVICHAGDTANKVPERAEMSLNIRYTDSENGDLIVDRIRRESGLDVRVDMQCDPVVFSEKTPVLQRMLESMRSHLGQNVLIKRLDGATDARHFADQQVPIAIIGLPHRGLHGDGEAMEASAIPAYEDFLLDFLADSEVFS